MSGYRIKDGGLRVSWKGAGWWSGNSWNVQDGGFTVMARYRIVLWQSWQGVGWWFESLCKVQDGGLTVMAR